jgi:hypothetical protein
MERRTSYVMTFVLGALAALALGRERPVALAQDHRDATRGDDLVVATGNNGGGRDTFVVLDPAKKRLAVYRLKDTQLVLVAIRNIQWELELDQYISPLDKASQFPLVADVKAEVEKQQQAQKKPR